MTTSENDFNKVAGVVKAKALPPFSIRLTLEERAALERAAVGLPLGAFVRERLFGSDLDRRSVVAVDFRGEVYALARWSGVRTKEINARFMKPENLPSVEATKAVIAMKMTDKLKSFINDLEASHRKLAPSIDFSRTQMVERHREERRLMRDGHAERWKAEEKERSARLPRGFSGIWGRITGKYRAIRHQNELETLKAWHRDRGEKDGLIAQQLDERRQLQRAIEHMRQERAQEVSEIQDEIAAYMAQRREDLPKLDSFNDKAKGKAQTKSSDKTRSWTKHRGHDGPDFGM